VGHPAAKKEEKATTKTVVAKEKPAKPQSSKPKPAKATKTAGKSGAKAKKK
jgi:hypothetical protein